jgi:phytoene synthase
MMTSIGSLMSSPNDYQLIASTATRARSYAYCERLARREAANFYHAFRLLPWEQRRAMCALYAFLRITDDLADAPGPAADKRPALDAWRESLHGALSGRHEHALFPALQHAVERYRIPRKYLDAAIDGVQMDLTIDRYDTFAELYVYCYRVASVVGLSCIHIWGCTAPEAVPYAEAAGIAFQLTNILRDLAEDATRGRIYLPREDLKRFDYSEDDLYRGRRDQRFLGLMRFETERAARYYHDAEPLTRWLPAPGRAVFQVMRNTYRALLEEIVRRDFDVFSGRVRLSRVHKLWLAAQALPVRWGWL